MRKTSVKDDTHNVKVLLVTTPDLMQMLGCGRCTATAIGEASGAKVQVGRRVLWSTEKIQMYIHQTAI